MTIRVLFVCLGNICRSPMAEAVFQRLVDEAGLRDQFTIDSAGTSGWHVGEPAHRGTRSILRKNGIEYTGSARQLERADFNRFDYILAMDDENLAGLQRMAPDGSAAVIARFLDFDPAAPVSAVPDPYYDNNFEEVYLLVRQGAAALLAHIRQENSL